MKIFKLFQTESCPDSLFTYPCKDSNSQHLSNRTSVIFDKNNIVKADWLKEYGADVFLNPTDEEMASAKIAVVMPNNGSGYYDVLDYYIQTLQKLVRSMKNKHNFKHIVVVLPPHSDEFSTDYARMAHYAVCGLIKGLGKTYAVNNLYVNGIILNESDPIKNLKDRVIYLASDNSCNTVGQIFKL